MVVEDVKDVLVSHLKSQIHKVPKKEGPNGGLVFKKSGFLTIMITKKPS